MKPLAAGALLAAAAAVLVLGQPSPWERWERMAPVRGADLAQRRVQIHPGELVHLFRDNAVNLELLDVRDEAEYNLFHLVDARRVDRGVLLDGSLAAELAALPANTVTVLMSDDEGRATEAWKLLTARNTINLYILEGGLHEWLDLFGHLGHEACGRLETVAASSGPGRLGHIFPAALGAGDPGADPDRLDAAGLEYTPKVKLKARKVKAGGCG